MRLKNSKCYALNGRITLLVSVIIFAIAIISLASVPVSGENKGHIDSWNEHMIDENLEKGETIKIVDINSDGNPDAIVTASTMDKVFWYEAPYNPTGNWTKHTIDSVDGPYGFALADMDLDGDQDIVVPVLHENKIAWYENGNSWHKYIIDDTFSSPRYVDVADLDGDGHPDVVAGNSPGSGQADIWWWKSPSNPKQNWSSSTRHYIKNNGLGGVWELNITDIDKDGHLDVVANDAYYNSILWFESPDDPTGTWTQHTIHSASSPRGLSVADIDKDGDMDVVASLYKGDRVSWFECPDNPMGTWTEHYIGSNLDGAYDCQTLDIDGDGDTDVVATGINGDELNWYESSENPEGTWHKHIIDNIDAVRSVFAGDIDGDGDTDVISATDDSSSSHGLRWHENILSPRILSIFPTPPGPDAGKEWVEIVNPNPDHSINLSGWTVSNRTGSIIAELPDRDLPAEAVLRIHFGKGANDSDFSDGEGDYYTGENKEVFQDGMDECALYNDAPSAAHIVDFVSWCGMGTIRAAQPTIMQWGPTSGGQESITTPPA